MPEIVLHQWEISPFCNKVRRLLRFKGLPFTRRDYNGMRAVRAARLSGAGKLPVLDYDGQRIQDSSAIARFIEQRHPEPSLFPPAPMERAWAELWEDWADEALYWFDVGFRVLDPQARRRAVSMLCAGCGSLDRLAMTVLFPRMYRFKLDAQGLGRLGLEGMRARFVEHLDRLETVLQRSPWLVNANPSIADIAVSAQLDEIGRTETLDQRMRAYPALADWMARCDAWGDGA